MALSVLEMRHLRTLAALRATGSLVRAAQLLNLTQSALSHQIKLLEDHFGAALFERKSVPPQFSHAGLRLLELADAALPLVEAAERDLARLSSGKSGQLRIVVECHTCFDWLMPAMDAFRQRWPEVELDIVSGFHADPIALVLQGRAEVAIVSERDPAETVDYHALFRFEIVALLANGHALTRHSQLAAEHFADQTLITYPVPDEMLDIVRQVLQPAGVQPAQRRTTELTIAMLQLVASGRGIAALPLWAVQGYLERGYVSARPIRAAGSARLTGELHLACSAATSGQSWLADFVHSTRHSCFTSLPEIELL
ncbi:LysR family transcriptional regulator [Verminephrobacter eiseniae]|uniref:LysR family transcriptional regulator n=1 Tax=Verminephrobacter eiseniae TaxID=364317 RepID=UPI0010D3B752|nr:LysR family transcriptional regulator [Verminephrobacter eiseniae]KAB7609605.1 LysR family transcriptional regulator [Verminephrobacter sp. Larva24]MCW5230412.1 LysR family transcriptional regulator [Verminephrobacter eiseniae]MCW5260383.1 LysR family transcriptional regulator [Verminephrobacter eiseniae]MCW5292146.1 LysR family transcriptional regulator [Verminephrobacter eiseniae]MCW8187225.1 LysR family transcriptional regulator [Verminephrobacter eiseniae]